MEHGFVKMWHNTAVLNHPPLTKTDLEPIFAAIFSTYFFIQFYRSFEGEVDAEDGDVVPSKIPPNLLTLLPKLPMCHKLSSSCSLNIMVSKEATNLI